MIYHFLSNDIDVSFLSSDIDLSFLSKYIVYHFFLISDINLSFLSNVVDLFLSNDMELSFLSNEHVNVPDFHDEPENLLPPHRYSLRSWW